MIQIKTESQIKGIRQSSKLAAQTLKYLIPFVKPGVNTQQLNDLAHQYILEHNAIPAPLNYNGFPKSICTSINDVVCHGIPSKNEILKSGDILNLDVTTILDGYYGDTSITLPVGEISKENQLLIDRTKKSLDLAISNIRPGRVLNNCVGVAIEKYLAPFNYGIVQELGGHGVGIKFHEDPFVFHYDIGHDDVVLKAGMTFTIEPMITATIDSSVWMDKKDGWTIRTKSGENSAQFEHTILVTNSGSEILTKL